MSAEEPTAVELLTATNARIYSLLQSDFSSMSIGDQTAAYKRIDELKGFRRELMAEVRTASGTVRLGDISGI